MNWQASIARTGYLVSLTSYLGFWLADMLRPGFVARYISVHIFLLSALVFGTWWAAHTGEWRDRGYLVYGAGIALGILFASLVWNTGEGLAEYRILLTAIAVFVPGVCMRLLYEESSNINDQ